MNFKLVLLDPTPLYSRDENVRKVDPRHHIYFEGEVWKSSYDSSIGSTVWMSITDDKKDNRCLNPWSMDWKNPYMVQEITYERIPT